MGETIAEEASERLQEPKGGAAIGGRGKVLDSGMQSYQTIELSK